MRKLVLPMLCAAAFLAACDDSPVTEDRLAIVNVNPSPGAIGIGTQTDVEITFSEILKAETVNASTVCLVAPGAAFDGCAGAVVPAQVGYDPVTLSVRLVPALTLDTSQDYVIRITTGAKGDPDGPLPAQVESSFRTAP